MPIIAIDQTDAPAAAETQTNGDDKEHKKKQKQKLGMLVVTVNRPTLLEFNRGSLAAFDTTSWIRSGIAARTTAKST